MKQNTTENNKQIIQRGKYENKGKHWCALESQKLKT